MTTRSDRIFEILENSGPRMRVSTILDKLKDKEDAPDLHPAAVTTAVRADNQSKDARGETPRFNHSGDGTEERGFISIREKKDSVKSIKSIVEDYQKSIPEIIEKANAEAKTRLKNVI